MAPKPGGAPAPATGATIRGKQAAVAEGQLLQFLRSVGYKDSLPPSTVAWLESAPVFRFLASKLSHDNFVTPEEEQEYSELMLARGPDSSLYDAVDGLSCCNSDRLSETMSDHTTTTVGATGAGSTHHHTTATTAGRGGVGSSNSSKEAADDFLTDLPDAEVSRLLEAEEARAAQLEAQVSALRAATCALEASTRQQADTQGSMFFGLKAQAAKELSAAKLDAQSLCEALDSTLRSLSGVAADLASLAQQPQAWLVCCAGGQSSYRSVDNAVNTQHLRGVQVLDVNDLSLDLHPPAASAAAAAAGGGYPLPPTPLAAAAAAKAAAGMQQPAAAGSGSIAGGGQLTPRGAQQQQKQGGLPLTPRQQQNSREQALAEALTEATNKRRAAHAARNQALNTEMSRQQHAFMLAFHRELDAALQEKGVRAQISAAQQVRSSTGEFGALLSKGPAAALHQLRLAVGEAESARRHLQEGSVLPLMTQVAQLNDCHIVVGDYDRHLAKVSYAMERKRAMLDALLRRASLHLVLLLAGLQELRQLGAVSGGLQQTAHLLEGHIAAVDARLQRSAAALEAFDKAQSSSNVQAGDTYLCALLAAADGSLVLPQIHQQGGAGGDTAAVAAAVGSNSGEPQTPGDAQRPANKSASSLFTPSYAPTSNIIDKLRGLSDNLDSSSTQLQRLLDLLPAQLAQLKASAARLHRTAFPPGQPPHGGADAQASSSSSAAASTAGGGGSVGGGSTWGGSQSAAASTRSMHSVHSTGSGGGGDAVSVAAARHPALLLTLPEVADATAALKGCWDQLQVEANRAINKQNETVKAMHRHNKECQALERTCMAKFFTAPEQLAADVDGLKAKVQQLQISQALSF